MRSFNIITRIFVVACLLALITVLGVVGISAESYSGTCGADGDGSNLTWTLDTETGVLSIEGTGAMAVWESSRNVPWYANRSNIKSVVIGNSVTSIGDRAFYSCENLTSVTIGNSVTSIGDLAFSECINLTSVEIPDGVTTIGESAFSFCISLISIEIPDSVTAIGEGAFSWCDSLISINIGNGVTSIGDYAFSDCSNLTSIEIPESVISIGDKAFSFCISLTSIDIPDSVTSIGDGVFSNCSSLTSIEIPDSVTSIGERAFSSCTGLTSIEIPNSVTSIGNSAFSDCTGLTSVNIGNGVTSIGDYAFSDCSNLTSIEILNSVTSIGDCAFYGCENLTSITIASDVTSIGDYAFSRCINLTSIEIRDSVTAIGEGAFAYCDSLTDIIIYSKNADIYDNKNTISDTAIIHGYAGSTAQAYARKHGRIFVDIISGTISDDIGGTCGAEGDGSNLTWTLDTETGVLSIEGTGTMADWEGRDRPPSWNDYKSNIKNIIITDGVTSIGDYAFSSCTGLTSVNIGNGVTSIGERAFSYCTGLTSIEIPDSVTSIGEDAFFSCSSLENIVVGEANTRYHSNGNCLIETKSKTLIFGCKNSIISDDGSVTSIGEYAFYYCTGLTSIEIPNSVTSIGEGAFSDCTGLISVTIGNGLTSIGEDAFNYCSSLEIIVVGEANTRYHSKGNCLIETANNTLILGCKKSVIPNDGSVTSIGSSAFAHCTGLTSITIPYGITSIGEYAFYYCTGLTSIEIPNGVTSIGEFAFNSCRGLTNISIPNSITNIGLCAFHDCSGLTYNEKDSVKYLGNPNTPYIVAVEADKSITNIVLPETIKVIYYDAFYWCEGLTNIIIPNSVTSIGEDAFRNCTGLTNITIGNGVTSIGDHAFEYCKGLTNITIPDSVTNIGDYAFSYCTGLTNISIPNSITNIGFGAFNYCSGLTYNEKDSVKYLGNPNTPYIVAIEADKSITNIVLPETVKIIDTYAFSSCTGLINVTIGNSVTSIAGSAFSECYILKSIVVDEANTVYHSNNNCLIETASKTLILGCQNSIIPEDGSVTSIGEFAFSCRFGLTDIDIPDKVTIIGNYAFYAAGLTSITIPDSITGIGNLAFYNCNNLEDIYIYPKDINVPNFSSYSATIHGYADSTAQAYAEKYGRTFVIIPEILDNITVLEAKAVYSADTAGAGVESLISYTKGDVVFALLYADKATGALKFKNASGEYEALYSKDGTAIMLNADTATQIAVIYDDIRGTVRYYVGEQVPYYGAEESRTLANDIAVNADFVNAEGSEKIGVLDGSLSNVKVYNIHDSGTAEILAFQDHTEQSHIRILSGVDMPWYMSIGYELEVYVDGIGQGKNTIETDVIFSSVVANGVDVYASQYGYNYFSVFEIDYVDVSDNREYYIIINPFTRVGAAKYDGTPAKIDIDVNGTYSFDENY